MEQNKNKSAAVAVLGLFTALVVVFQLMSYVVHVGTFNLSLVLVPIVLAAVLYGPKYGTLLGTAFGIVVTAATVTGMDAGAYMMFAASPVITVLLCLAKGALCGMAAGFAAKLFRKNQTISAFAAAIAAPVVNTGIFLLSMVVFYRPLLYSWAGGTNVVTYVLTGLVGLNFLIEVAVNVILTPTILRIVKAVRKI